MVLPSGIPLCPLPAFRAPFAINTVSLAFWYLRQPKSKQNQVKQLVGKAVDAVRGPAESGVQLDQPTTGEKLPIYAGVPKPKEYPEAAPDPLVDTQIGHIRRDDEDDNLVLTKDISRERPNGRFGRFA